MLHGLFISGVVFTLHSHFITSPILSISTFNHHIKSCYTWKATVSISVSWQPVLRMETDDHYEKGVEEHWEIWGSFNAPSATFWTLKACLLWHSLVLFVFLIIFFLWSPSPVSAIKDSRIQTLYMHTVSNNHANWSHFLISFAVLLNIINGTHFWIYILHMTFQITN